MNDLQQYSNTEFGTIRTIEINGEPWFVGKDVALALGYSNFRDALSKHVDDDYKGVAKCDSLGGAQEMTIINEAGLYKLVFASKLPSAKRFTNWVTSEVLPSIRKTGGYNNSPTTLSTSDKIALIAQGHGELKAEIDNVKNDLEEFKISLPLLPEDADSLLKAVKCKGVEVLGGKLTPAYKDKSTRDKTYSDIYGQLHRAFDVKSYKGIKRKDMEAAKRIVEEYSLPYTLHNIVLDLNSRGEQMTIEDYAR